MKDFSIGDRVQLHPATSQWMQCDRYGEVVGFSKPIQYRDSFTDEIKFHKAVKVKLDKSGKTVRQHPNNLFHA